MKLPKYVQHWVDHDGRAHCYFRRPGYPRVRLPGLPWSPSFMAAYEAAFSGPRAAIGAGRIRPGSVSAVVTEYFGACCSALSGVHVHPWGERYNVELRRAAASGNGTLSFAWNSQALKSPDLPEALEVALGRRGQHPTYANFHAAASYLRESRRART